LYDVSGGMVTLCDPIWQVGDSP